MHLEKADLFDLDEAAVYSTMRSTFHSKLRSKRGKPLPPATRTVLDTTLKPH